MMGADEDSLEIPEANLSDELGEIRAEPKRRIFESQPGPTAKTPDMGLMNKQSQVTYPQPSTNVDKIIEVPLNIQIPEDKDEIKINLNLQIVIKRQ
jgi:hypothetical protein